MHQLKQGGRRGPLWRTTLVGLTVALIQASASAQVVEDSRGIGSKVPRTYPAVLLPGATALIKAQQDERVAEVSIKLGSRVQKEQVILRFVDAEERVRVERATAVLDQARAEHNRIDRLHAEGQVSDEFLEKTATSLRLAQADLDLAVIRLAELTIRAPFTGVVAERYVDPGTSVELGDPLFTVVALAPLRLQAMLPEAVLPELREQTILDIALTTPPVSFEVPLPKQSIVIDPASRTFLLQVEIDNQDERLTPGTSCLVSIRQGSLPER